MTTTSTPGETIQGLMGQLWACTCAMIGNPNDAECKTDLLNARSALLAGITAAVDAARAEAKEEAAKTADADNGMIANGNYSLGPSVSSRIAAAIRASIPGKEGEAS